MKGGVQRDLAARVIAAARDVDREKRIVRATDVDEQGRVKVGAQVIVTEADLRLWRAIHKLVEWERGE